MPPKVFYLTLLLRYHARKASYTNVMHRFYLSTWIYAALQLTLDSSLKWFAMCVVYILVSILVDQGALDGVLGVPVKHYHDAAVVYTVLTSDIVTTACPKKRTHLWRASRCRSVAFVQLQLPLHQQFLTLWTRHVELLSVRLKMHCRSQCDISNCLANCGNFFILRFASGWPSLMDVFSWCFNQICCNGIVKLDC